MKKPFAMVGLTAVVLILMLVAFFTYQQVKAGNPATYAQRVAGALGLRDGQGLAELVSPYEAESYGLTKPQIQRFFESYVFPSLPAGNLTVLGSEQNETKTWFYYVGIQPGWEASFEIRPMQGSLGSPQLLTACLIAAGTARHQASAQGKMAGLNALSQISSVDVPDLSALGIKGIVRKPNEGLISFEKWHGIIEQQIQNQSGPPPVVK